MTPDPMDLRFYRLRAAQQRTLDLVRVCEAFCADQLPVNGEAVGLRKAISDMAFEAARAGYLLACEHQGLDRAGALALWEQVEWDRSGWIPERTGTR